MTTYVRSRAPGYPPDLCAFCGPVWDGRDTEHHRCVAAFDDALALRFLYEEGSFQLIVLAMAIKS